MIEKSNLDKNLWKCIENHYEKECYTDCLKDLCLFLVQMIQEKSEVDTLDGEKLITHVFSENNPKLLINNFEKLSEKDEQRGFGFIIRGIICAIRNPISHDANFNFTKTETDSIVLFVNNYILPKFNDSKEFTYVNDWYKFIFIENKNDSKEYSDILLENIPKKQKLNILIKVIDEIHLLKEGKYEYLINNLYKELTVKEKKEIQIIINKHLITMKDGTSLMMFFNHFPPCIWKSLDKLVRARIEDIVYNAIRDGRILDTFGSIVKGPLGCYANSWVSEFDSIDKIINLLWIKMDGSINEGKYVVKYFAKYITTNDIMKEKDLVHKGLKAGNSNFYDLIKLKMKIGDDKLELNKEFKKDYDNFKEESANELPF